MPPTTLVICAYRNLSLPTHHSVVRLLTSQPEWQEMIVGEAGINRARSLAASNWYRDTTEECFLMLDDDISFEPEEAVGITDKCRAGYDIIAGAYPFRNGKHLAVRTFPGDTSMAFAPGAPPQEVVAVSTGFFAVHRRVIEAMIARIPLCYEGNPGSFWPLFMYEVVKDEQAGGWSLNSEDYFFTSVARSLGFKVWVDRSIFLNHQGTIQVNVHNMAAIYKASEQLKETS